MPIFVYYVLMQINVLQFIYFVETLREHFLHTKRCSHSFAVLLNPHSLHVVVLLTPFYR